MPLRLSGEGVISFSIGCIGEILIKPSIDGDAKLRRTRARYSDLDGANPAVAGVARQAQDRRLAEKERFHFRAAERAGIGAIAFDIDAFEHLAAFFDANIPAGAAL